MESLKKPNKLIPSTGPSITKKEISYVTQAARDGWNENYQKYISMFEEKFSEYVGRRYALATSSCTGALHLSYLSLGLKRGDEVVVPDITWIASVEPLYYIGAKPVFADINPETWCIDEDSIEDNIGEDTKAILVVDLYGNMPNMDKILKIAADHNLTVIEDAAEAVGSEYNGRKAGSFGDVSCFSFHGSKTMVTGEGGMLLTDKKEVIERARYYNDHCKDPKKTFWNLEIGYKYKMSNFQAACGLAQLERINELLEKKGKIFYWYKERLSKIPGIRFNAEKPGTKNTYWMVTVVPSSEYSVSKEALVKELEAYNIQARPVFYPLSTLPPIKTKANTPNSVALSKSGINLPCGMGITKYEVDYICAVLQDILDKKRHETKVG